MPEPTTRTSGTGLAPNVAGALAYLLGPVTGVLFLLIEPEDRFVRFHAAQSTIVGFAVLLASIAVMVIGTGLMIIPLLGWIAAALLTLVFGVGTLALWIGLMVQAYGGRERKVPGIGDWVRKLAEPGSVRAG